MIVWTIDRPQARNALDLATIAALTTGVTSAPRDVRVAVLTGAGDSFVSGGDLRELRDRTSVADAEDVSDRGFLLAQAIAAAPFPVIAVLNGGAIGGGAELAVACDLRVAEARAFIAFKQVRMGVTSAWGAAARLRAIVGASAAARLLFRAESIDANEGRRLGLFDDVCDDGAGVETALAWARDIACGAPGAIAATKRLLRAEGDVRAVERAGFVETWTSDDHKEAVEAWFERRSATWRT